MATRVVYGDLFCIKKSDKTARVVNWIPTEEKFFIKVHNLTQEQVSSENLIRYISCMGEILYFSYPVRKENGSYSITIRASIRFRQRIIFSVYPKNEMGYNNEVTFQFHHFPNNYCDFYKVIGHKLDNCEHFVAYQQQIEEKQAEADVVMAAMQNIVEHQM